MEVTVLFSYTESVIPRGCRKARNVRFDDGTIEVSIREIQEEQAPIALIRTDYDNGVSIGNTDYRWFEGELWTSRHVTHQIGKEFGPGPEPDAVIDSRKPSHASSKEPGDGNSFASREANERRVQDWAAGFILINGRGWQTSGEPCFFVSTRGFNLRKHVDLEHGICASSPRECYFSLLQKNEVKALVNEGTDGTDSSDPIPDWQFEVLLPESIAINSAQMRVVKVFGIRPTSFSSKAYELIEADIPVPAETLVTGDHLEMAKRHFGNVSDGPLPTILFDESSSIGGLLVSMRKQIRQLTEDKLELMGKSSVAQGEAQVLEF